MVITSRWVFDPAGDKGGETITEWRQCERNCMAFGDAQQPVNDPVIGRQQDGGADRALGIATRTITDVHRSELLGVNAKRLLDLRELSRQEGAAEVLAIDVEPLAIRLALDRVQC